MEIQISKEKWNSLSDAERNSLSLLGITPAERKPATPARLVSKQAMEEKGYYLGVKTKCLTCQTVTVENFYMVPMAGGKFTKTATCPVGFPVKEQIEPDQWTKAKTKTCKHCHEMLSQWDKETLIQFILHGQKRCLGCAKDEFKPQQLRMEGF